MTLWAIRPMLPEDVPATLEMRGRTRENAVGLAEMAEVYGITPASAAAELRAGQTGWLCEEASAVMGFAIGDRRTGEVIVVAVLPSHEGRGIGRALLTLVQDDLLASGHRGIGASAALAAGQPGSGGASFGLLSPSRVAEHGRDAGRGSGAGAD